MVEGGTIPEARILRSESLQRLSSSTWQLLEDYGVSTLIDLRNPEQREEDLQTPPASLQVIELPIELGLYQGSAFGRLIEQGRWGTSHFLADFIREWPDRVAKVLTTLSHCSAGGVLFHCSKGSDRTGVIAVALLNILGVQPDDIVADYTVTAQRLKVRGVPLGVTDDTNEIQAVYRKIGGSPEEGVLAAVQFLREHRPLDTYLSAADQQRIRSRFLG